MQQIETLMAAIRQGHARLLGLIDHAAADPAAADAMGIDGRLTADRADALRGALSQAVGMLDAAVAAQDWPRARLATLDFTPGSRDLDQIGLRVRPGSLFAQALEAQLRAALALRRLLPAPA